MKSRPRGGVKLKWNLEVRAQVKTELNPSVCWLDKWMKSQSWSLPHRATFLPNLKGKKSLSDHRLMSIVRAPCQDSTNCIPTTKYAFSQKHYMITGHCFLWATTCFQDGNVLPEKVVIVVLRLQNWSSTTQCDGEDKRSDREQTEEFYPIWLICNVPRWNPLL